MHQHSLYDWPQHHACDLMRHSDLGHPVPGRPYAKCHVLLQVQEAVERAIGDGAQALEEQAGPLSAAIVAYLAVR